MAATAGRAARQHDDALTHCAEGNDENLNASSNLGIPLHLLVIKDNPMENGIFQTMEVIMKETLVRLDILRYDHNGLSQREIAQKLEINRGTVKKYIENKDLLGMYHRREPYPSKLDTYRDVIEKYLGEDTYKATWIYDKIQAMGFSGSYEIVKRLVGQIKEKNQQKAYVRFETEPGCQAQVDFGEFQVVNPDQSTTTLYLFALILGFSRKMFAELVERCDMPTFYDCHSHAFNALGGVPQEILYDRMRNVFRGHRQGRDHFTQTMVSFACHYQFKPLVAPAYAPWVKGKVERPFSFIREGFWRGYEYTDLNRANHDLQTWLTQKDERIHGTTKERVRERYRREVPFLSPLPKAEFDTSCRLYRIVHKDCTVLFEGNRYVVSHHLVGKQVVIRVKERSLRVYVDDALQVTYRIPEGIGNLVQDPRFYEELRKDRGLQQRKFGQRKGRAKKTISPSVGRYEVAVEIRPVSQYDHYIQEGVARHD